MTVFCMIATESSQRYTPLALSSFEERTAFQPDDLFLLIDNSQGKGTSSFSPPERWQVLINDTPKGFAANMNQGLELAREKNQDACLLNNDVVFTTSWFTELKGKGDTLRAVVSNREFQYETPDWNLHVVMTLDDYLGKEALLEGIAEKRKDTVPQTMKALVVPFCCAFLPHRLLQTVGLLDEEFGPGGAEDFDYCLRSWLAEIPVAYAMHSFVLHFGGKSSYDGKESKAEQQNREKFFHQHFRNKWGASLHDLVFAEEETEVEKSEAFQARVAKGEYTKIISDLQKKR